MKIFVVLVLIAILAALGSGLYYLINDRGDSRRTLRALTLRIGLSISLFVLLMIAFALGWIEPHGVLPSGP